MLREYRLALFGIEAPGGFQTWDAARGKAERHHWIPIGMSVNVDAYGDLAPKPAASRLYVPYERSVPVRAAVTRAVLLHAGQLWKAHVDSADWTIWYQSFLRSWDGKKFALLREDPDIRRNLTELLAAKPRILDPDFYVSVARFHSYFGEIVLTEGLDGAKPDVDIRQPLSPGHINAAAAKAGIDAGKIDAAVESLFEFLGWDITKGQPLE